MSPGTTGSLAWLLCWRGVLGLSDREFWVYPIGLFHDMIAARQIMDGSEEKPVRAGSRAERQMNYEDDSIFLLE